MKKTILFILALIGIGTHIHAQVIYAEDFESLNVGEGIAQQVPANWTTWTDNPGSAEDPLVSNAYSASPSNSLLIGEGNDVIMTVGNLTENRYRMSFKLYIPANACAFYIPMQEFDAENEIYTQGMQIYFLNGEATIDGGGQNDAAEFSFNHDTWLEVVQYFDLDNETTDVIINGEVVYTGNWSNGISNYSNTLQGFDVFGYDAHANPESYLDDIVFEQVDAVNPAQNLSLQLQNDFDISINWEAPVSGTPASYYLYRDDEFIEEITDGLSFMDNHLYPGNYEYYVMANYGTELGLSIPTNTESIEVEGGTQRQLALLEIFTGTECDNARFIDNALTLLGINLSDYKVLSFLEDEDYSISSLLTRKNFYTSFYDENEDDELTCPSSIVNGMYGKEGYMGSLAFQKNFYQDNLEATLALNALYTLTPDVSIESTSPYSFNVEVSVEELLPYYDTDEIKLFAVISENEIDYSWQGISQINNLVRYFEGKTIDFTSNPLQNETFTITLTNVINAQNCDLTIFLQNMDNAQILEAYSVPLTEFIGVNQHITQKSNIYPNPSSGMIFISSSESVIGYTILNHTGQRIQSLNADSDQISVDLSSLSKGIYFIQVKTLNGVETHKILIQ